MFKSRGMHVNTELRVATRSILAVMCGSCAVVESCQSLRCVCVSQYLYSLKVL